MAKPWEKYQSKPWDRYSQPEQQQETWVTDIKHGLGELVDGWIHEGVMASPATADLMAQSERLGIKPEGAVADTLRGDNGIAKLTPEPTTLHGKLLDYGVQLAPGLLGFGAGTAGLEESGLMPVLDKLTAKAPGAFRWGLDKAAKGAAGTLGSDVLTGEDPTNLVEGGLGNVAAETLFHIPMGLRAMKVLMAKNGSAIQAAADHIGVTPSMGVTTTRNWVRSLENAVAKLPGGNLVNIQNAKSMAAMASFVEGIKSKLGYQGDTSALGNEIKQAVEKAETEFKDESEKLYDKIMKNAGGHQMTNTRRFVRLVEQEYGVNPKPGMAEMAAPPVVRRYMGYIDAAGKTPTSSGYSNLVMSLSDARKVLKGLDDYIGTGEHADADTAAAKRMASALRQDIGGTFDALGLGGQWRMIQDRYAAGITLLNQARGVFGRAATSDAIYTRLFGAEAGAFSPKGVDTLTPLKRIMTQDEWNHLAAEVVHRMGQESAGTAGAGGREFSPAIFLTNWNRLNPAVKEMLFDADHNYDLEQLAKLSEGFEERGKLENHSGTAHSLANMHTLSTIGAGLTGHPYLLATLGGQWALTNATARLLINPEAARLLVDAAHAVEPNQVQRIIIRMIALGASHPELAPDLSALAGDDNQ